MLILIFFLAGPSHEESNTNYTYKEMFCKLRENNILITQASSNDSRDFLMTILKKNMNDIHGQRVTKII